MLGVIKVWVTIMLRNSAIDVTAESSAMVWFVNTMAELKVINSMAEL